jgi:hypothetical protein
MEKVVLRFKKGSFLFVGIFFFILALASSLAYANWTQIPPNLISGDWHLCDVNFTSSDEGWAVGWKDVPTDFFPVSRYRGFLLHFRNFVWTEIDPPDDGSFWRLYAVHFTASTEGWAVGWNASRSSGVLLHYRNGSWTSVDPPSVSPNWYLTSVHFTSSNEGWAVGWDLSNRRGILLYYLNGIWAVTTPPTLSSKNWSLNRVHFTSPEEGWAVGWKKRRNGVNYSGVLLHYQNGSWTFVTPPSVSLKWRLTGVHFTSSNEGWAVGWKKRGDGVKDRGVLLHYQNGSWTFVTPPSVSPDWRLAGVHFTSPDEGWAVGVDDSHKRGVLLNYWNDSWIAVPPPDQSCSDPCVTIVWDLQGVHFTSPAEGWAVGSRSTAIDLFPSGVLWEYDGVLFRYN